MIWEIMGNRNQVELLAPAGNPAAFYGAVNAGADAVYMGSRRFGARAYADNFTIEELSECIRYGHIMGCRLYLTVNTLMKETELAELREHILPLYESGLDGVIVQDLGAFRLLKRWFPGLELHASTQMTLCSSNGARLLKDMGACRIVPARELSLEEIKIIKRKVDIEIETFIHGAMCYCYSGQCLFSSILGGRSGNRGRCAQPCRLPYSVENDGHRSRERYYLSMKDMCTADHLPELIEAGIDSFKIEGRMKKPEYAAGVTAVYRRCIDSYYELRERYGAKEAAERFRVSLEDKDILSSLYIRSQVQSGYYFQRKGGRMITLDSPAYSGSDEPLLTDIRRRYLQGKRRLPLIFRAAFLEGEAVSLTAGRWEDPKPEEGIPLSVTVTGDKPERAAARPITEENVKRQLAKLGDTSFFPQEISVELDPQIFYPLQKINELRRLAVQRMEEVILERAGRGRRAEGNPERTGADRQAEANPERAGADRRAEAIPERTDADRQIETEALEEDDPMPVEKSETSRQAGDGDSGRRQLAGFSVSVATEEQLAALADWLAENPAHVPDCIYLWEELASSPEGRSFAEARDPDCPVLIALPYILREEEVSCLERLYAMCGPKEPFSGYLIRSLDGFGFLEQKGKNGLWHLDASVYTWNRAAVEQYGGEIDSFCLPYELKAAEQRQLADGSLPQEKIVYGRIPMMVTANCVLDTAGQCRKQEGQAILIDRYGKRFPVVCCCAHCVNIIYNCVPLSLHRELSGWKGRVRLRVDLTVEDGAETRSVLDLFLGGREHEVSAYTTGHEKRGVM